MAGDINDKALKAANRTFTRRSFLKVGLVGTGLAAAGGVGLALRSGLLRELPAEGLQVLSQREFSTLSAVCERICPAAGEGAPGAVALKIPETIDAMLAEREPWMQKEFKTLLGIFDNALAGFLFEGRLKPFTKLTPEEQDASLQSWERSRVGFRRTAYQALRRLIGSMYYASAPTWERIGYAGPPDVSAYRAQRAAERAAEVIEEAKP